MIALARKGDSDSILAGGIHGGAQRMHSDQGADSVVAVDQAQGRGGALHADPSLRIDAAYLQAFAIGLDAAQSMRGQAKQIGQHQHTYNIGGVLLRQAQSLERTDSELRQFGFRYRITCLC
ncbi:hypothetical protein D3C87_1711500 [compost metagenome]